VVRGLIPINVQEGDVAVYWPSPAARAMRLTHHGETLFNPEPIC
jgi:hypothetical protein